ncbi:MAG: hypothetical protein MUE60_02155 [Candidatus Eisenbacteria bacterium]|jgi:hypothetical protein|nr:hypothetical protein [Candidatus Eisenbacteria bacterium]
MYASVPRFAALCALAIIPHLTQAQTDVVNDFGPATMESNPSVDFHGPAGLTLLPFDDGFDAPELDAERWTVYTQNGSCSVEDGYLRQDLVAGGGDSWATVVPKHTFAAGSWFDLEAKFDASHLPATNSWFMVIRITVVDHIQVEMIRSYHVSRHAWSSQCRYWSGTYWGPWSQQTWTTEDVTTVGWLGFDRLDGSTTLRAWYRGSGAWIPWASFADCGGTASVSVTTNNWVQHAYGYGLWDSYEVNIPGAPYLGDGQGIRLPVDSGIDRVNLTRLAWDAVVPDNTSVAFQLRAAPGAGGAPGAWTEWFGPGGSPDLWFDASPVPVTFTPDYCQWVQWRVRLTSADGLETPRVNSVQLDWETNPQPVELASFSAAWEDQRVCLRWSTASESDNVGFRVLHRESDAQPWKPICDLIPGAGTTQEPRQYACAHDADPLSWHHYLLEDVDARGTATRHGPVSVAPAHMATNLSPNCPEPFSGTTRWLLPGEAPPHEAWIADLAGRRICDVPWSWTGGAWSLAWHGRDGSGRSMPAGPYVLSVLRDGALFRQVCVKAGSPRR